MPASTWNIQKVSQPTFAEYSARDSVDFFVTVPGAGVATKIAPLTSDLEEKIPTLYANSLVVGWQTSFVGTLVIRKFFMAGQGFVDEVFAIAVGTGTSVSTSLLECAEIWAINPGAAPSTIRVTAIARP